MQQAPWHKQLEEAQTSETKRRTEQWLDLITELSQKDPTYRNLISFRCDRSKGVMMDCAGFKVYLDAQGEFVRLANAHKTDIENIVRMIHYHVNAKRWRDKKTETEKFVTNRLVRLAATVILEVCATEKLRQPNWADPEESKVEMVWPGEAVCLVVPEGMRVTLIRSLNREDTAVWPLDEATLVQAAKQAAERLTKRVPVYSQNDSA